MNIALCYVSKQPFRNIEYFSNLVRLCVFNISRPCTTTIDVITTELIQKNGNTTQLRNSYLAVSSNAAQYKVENDKNYRIYLEKLSINELDKLFLDNLLKNKDKEIIRLVSLNLQIRKLASESVFIKLFRAYSLVGETDVVSLLQDYSKLDPDLYEKHGHFQHYLARAQCMKGNSDKGLYLLKDSYNKYVNLRSLYRCIFQELIQDSVSNRSEASLVVFKKYVIEFSDVWKDHYPLICLWYICWSSDWFSDQMLSNELLEESKTLRSIIQEKSVEFSISALHNHYNEDAVMRLLQLLLKYNMMLEYEKVLQVLFNYKLRKRDLRGCTEIIKNYEALGLVLPSVQQSQYIHMLIGGHNATKPVPKTQHSKSFKLKF